MELAKINYFIDYKYYMALFIRNLRMEWIQPAESYFV